MAEKQLQPITKYSEAIGLIYREQEKIIGPTIAKMMVDSVTGLKKEGTKFLIEGDPKTVLSELVDQYATIFGKASIMVSKEAIKKVNPSFAANELPDNLK